MIRRVTPMHSNVTGAFSADGIGPEDEYQSQIAARAALRRAAANKATDEYLADLVAKVGEPTAEQIARAEAVTNRILSRRKLA
jgi:hypothetical protein